MKSPMKFLLVVGTLAAGIIGALYLIDHNLSDQQIESFFDADTAHPCNEVLHPYDISQNPYKFKGHSGILEMRGIPLILPDGRRIPQFVGAGYGLRFTKMIDAHTATYAVRSGGYYGPEEDSQIAVELSNSDPPEPTKSWCVYVVGAEDFRNGLGEKITLATLKFEKYYVAPPEAIKDQPAPTVPSSQPKPEATPMFELPQAPTNAQSIQRVAPIERREPPSTSNTSPSFAGNEYKWETQANGNEILIGPKGKCATLSGLSGNDQDKPHLILPDGSIKSFDTDQTGIARRAAIYYCASN